MKDILKSIETFPDEYLAIKKQAKKYFPNGSTIDDERMNILHRPWVARLNCGIMLYKAADIKWISEAEATINRAIPDFYKRFLTNINGCFLYDISLFGLIHSLTHSFLQCHSLITANNDWIKEFDVDQNLFHFGGGTYSDEENTGYFYRQNKIMSLRKNGKSVKEWTNFSDFLNDELDRAEREMLKDVPREMKLVVTE